MRRGPCRLRYRGFFETTSAALALMCPLLLWAADVQTVVMELGYRTASEVIPVLKPLVSAPGTVTGLGSTLVVKGSSEEIEAVRSVVAHLDRQPKNLMISVRHSLSDAVRDSGARVRATVRSGDVTVSNSRSETGHSSADVKVYGTRSHSDASDLHYLRVLEGYPAFITFGEAVPAGHQTLIIFDDHEARHASVYYHNVERGFYVLPTLAGKQVTLTISPFRESLNRGAGFDTQSQSTTVSGPLGEWISLGGLTNQDTQHDSAIAYSTRSASESTHDIDVKVDVVD